MSNILTTTLDRLGRSSSSLSRISLIAGLALLMLAVSPSQGGLVVGSPIMGLHDTSSLSTLGVVYSHFESNNPINIHDGNTSTYDDTYYGFSGYYAYSYFGLASFSSAISSSQGLAIDVNFHLFIDGGWFGAKGLSSDPITQYLVAPDVQVTSDGVTWTTVSSTSNYIATLSGLSPAFQTTSDVTFQTSTAVAGATGVRLIGLGGGYAGSGNGFVGVSEVRVSTIPFTDPSVVPEPTSLAGALTALGITALAVRRRRPC